MTLSYGCEEQPAKPGPSVSAEPVAATPEPGAAGDAALLAALGPTVPPDVDPAELARLRQAKDDAGIVALHERLAWRTFVAVNWPTDAAGKPRGELGAVGDPAWMQWKESFDVFLANGGAPSAWGEPRTLPGGKPTPRMAALAEPEKVPRAKRLLFTLGAKPRGTRADELDQAFRYPLWDQSGNIIYYEVLLNRSEFDYVVSNELYNIDGQIAFAAKNPGKDLDPASCNHPNRTMVVMPSGKYGGADEGAIEIKIAWKVLTDADIAGRYLVADGLVPAGIKFEHSCKDGLLSASIDGDAWKPVKLGMVGFHISHKTETAPQWAWATFEHVDNLAVDPAEVRRLAAAGERLRPSFHDPDCETCPVNACVDPPAPGQPPARNQLERVIPIDPGTAAHNRELRRVLAAQGSALQYYELVGVQFPTDPEAAPTSPRADGPKCGDDTSPPANLPDSVTNKAGGRPHTGFLTNMTMESFFQAGNQAACHQVENGNCPKQISDRDPVVFATESCIGCHSSATIATGGTAPGAPDSGRQLSADFSWLLTTKAHWKQEVR